MPPQHARPFLIALLLIFAALFIAVIGGFAAPLILGAVLAGLTFPLYRWFQHSVVSKNLAALIVVVLISIVIILPTLALLTLLTREAIGLVNAARDQLLFDEAFLEVLRPLTERFDIDLSEITSRIEPTLRSIGATISSEIGGFLSDAVRLALSFFIMLLTTFYLLRDGKKLGEFLMKFSPLPSTEEYRLYGIFKTTGSAVLYGNFVSALVQGILGGIGFLLFDLPAPVLWGALMGFLALIPLLGPYLVFLPAALYLFGLGQLWPAIGFLLYNVIIVSSVDNIIKPKLIGDKIRIHPLLTLLSILGGLKIFGIIGILYGPVIFAVFLSLVAAYEEHTRGYRNTSST